MQCAYQSSMRSIVLRRHEVLLEYAYVLTKLTPNFITIKRSQYKLKSLSSIESFNYVLFYKLSATTPKHLGLTQLNHDDDEACSNTLYALISQDLTKMHSVITLTHFIWHFLLVSVSSFIKNSSSVIIYYGRAKYQNFQSISNNSNLN